MHKVKGLQVLSNFRFYTFLLITVKVFLKVSYYETLKFLTTIDLKTPSYRIKTVTTFKVKLQVTYKVGLNI